MTPSAASGVTRVDGEGKAKGRCPVCTGDFVLRKDGTLWTHNGDRWDGIWRLRCEGSGGDPR